MARKKKLPDEIQEIIDNVQNKEIEEDAQEARELVQQIREERDSNKDYWDVPKDQKIEVFDPTLSYELTGYRPITMDQGLDFNPDDFREMAIIYNNTGRYTEYPKGRKLYNDL